MKGLVPINYKLHLEPDLTNFSFVGCTELLVEAQVSVREISLNILDLALWDCSVRQESTYVNCSYFVDPHAEEFRLILPQEMSGPITVQINYQGCINDRMAGFYRSRYLYQGQTRYIAVTQFEESDARRAFPCLDHPSQKATFDIEIDIDPDLVAISNTDVRDEKLLDNGKKRVQFIQTPRMSPYLVFFGVGMFESVRDEVDNRVHVVTLPDKKKYTRLGLEFGRKSLAFSETYYGIPYPLAKLDLIAIPDFAFGAMENWGAVTFRENLLLYYPNVTSKSGKERICEVIAHEIAHQWFGNLVTPADWKYLWLNESFATYFGSGVVDHYFPQWDVWGQFLHGYTASAMARDGLHETFAIEIPGGEHVVINASTAPIIYSKGGSILRQVEGYVGSENLQKGLQNYFTANKYGNAASHHLWDSLEKVSQKQVTAMIKSWIEQPGFPLVEVKREGGHLVLNQRRFTYLPNQSTQKWLVPVTIDLYLGDGTTQNLTMLLDDVERTVQINQDTASYKVNSLQTGFYRVRYHDPQNLQELALRVRDKMLPPEDRWGLQNDLYALVMSGVATLEEYLDFLSHYRDEDEFLPLVSIADNLAQAFCILNSKYAEKITSLAKPWFASILTRIGKEPVSTENHITSILREKLIWHAALYGSEQVIDFARSEFEALMRGDTVDSDITKSVMQVGALTGGDQAFEWLEKQFGLSDIEHERMNILVAMGCFRDSAMLARSRQYVLENIPARNKFIPIVAMAMNPYAIPSMWDWYVSNRAAIEQFHPIHFERVIAAIVPGAGIDRAEEVKAFFSDYIEKNEKFRDVVNLSLEQLEINNRMRKKHLQNHTEQ
jgi:tricorn protease interacting factor F2/3